MRNDVGLLDTNVLVYAADALSPQHRAALRLRDDALRGTVRACLAMQVLAEFYAVVTDPRRVTTPLQPQQACVEIANYVSSPIAFAYPSRQTLAILRELLETHELHGQQVHDACLAATMLANGIRRIYTANTGDFERFGEIEVINPFEA